MAYAFEQEEDKDKDQEAGEPQQLGAESAVIADEAPQPTEQKEGGSGQYVNLQSYIGANASRKFGEEVAGKVGESVKVAQGAQEQAHNQFRTAADTGSVDSDQGLVKEATERPEDVFMDQAKKASFVRQRDARYQGPNQLADTDYYQPAQRATREASEQATASETEGGRNALLQQYYGTGKGRFDYTPGQQKLDQVLIQMDPNSRAAFDQQRASASQLNPAFQNLQSELGSYAQQRKAATDEASRYAKEQVGGAQGKTRADIEAAYQGIVGPEGTRTKAIADEQARLARGEVSANELGQNAGGSLRTFGVDPSAYMRTGAEPTIHQAVDPTQRGRYGALAGLMGQGEDWLPYGDLAGTYNPEDDITYNKDQFMNEVNARGSEYDRLLNSKVFGQSQGASNGEVTYGGTAYNPYWNADPNSEYGFMGGINSPLTQGSLQDNLNYADQMKQQWGDRVGGPMYDNITQALDKLRQQKGYGKQVKFV